jgi:peptidoglycan/LPS O-acetylase OafA/YrhL
LPGDNAAQQRMPTNTAEHESTAGPLRELTSLRFIAAFAVLLLHYRDLLGPMPAWLMRGIVGGQYGVTFFFILSGFILSYRYRAWFADGVNAADFWRFQRFRLARIYPIYLVGLLLDTPWHVLERAQAGQLAAAGPTYFASWLINLLGLQAWVPAVPFAMFWNTPAWSVAAEFFFYASFPFLCAGLSRRFRNGPGLVLTFALVVAGGVAMYAGVIYAMNYLWRADAQTQYIVLVYNPLLRYSEFFAGCLAGHYFLQMQAGREAAGVAGIRGRRLRDAIILACLLAVCVRVWMPDYTGPSAGRWLFDVSIKYAVFILPFTALILAVASGRSCLSWLLERPWMHLLGEASYSLYIIHWSVTSFLRLGYLGNLATPAVHALFMVATVGASVLCYRFIELPWRARLRGPQHASPLAS